MNEERVALILTLLIRRCPECPQLEVKDASSKLYGIAGKGARAVVWLGFRETELRGDGLRGDGLRGDGHWSTLEQRGLVLPRFAGPIPDYATDLCLCCAHTIFRALPLCLEKCVLSHQTADFPSEDPPS